MLSQITERLDIAHIDYQRNISMKEKTWIHRGPLVPLFISPNTIKELEDVIRILQKESMSFKVIGHTSNLYILDSYNVDAIVATNKLSHYSIEGEFLKCNTGVSISRLSKECITKGYKGFEGLIELPGTVGAAIVNNASCFKCSPSSMLVSATILSLDGHIVKKETVDKDFFVFSHRSSAIKRGEKQAIILEAVFKLHQITDIDDLIKTAECNARTRKETQDGKANNLGSIFSKRKERKRKITSLGISKAPFVILLRLTDYLFRDKHFYKIRRNELLLRLYGYRDVIPYISKKNSNCFLWLDSNADKQFIRYMEFMNKCFDCGPLEIEILK